MGIVLAAVIVVIGVFHAGVKAGRYQASLLKPGESRTLRAGESYTAAGDTVTVDKGAVVVTRNP